MSVYLGKAREIIHLEDIVSETSLLTHSRGGADLFIYCVSSSDDI